MRDEKIRLRGAGFGDSNRAGGEEGGEERSESAVDWTASENNWASFEGELEGAVMEDVSALGARVCDDDETHLSRAELTGCSSVLVPLSIQILFRLRSTG